MKLTTYGMWEEPRQSLVKTISENSKFNCKKEQVEEALLGPVITKIIETSFSYQKKLEEEKSPLNFQERTLATYKEALATMLPTLADSLGKSEELLASPVEQFISESFGLSEQNIDYLMKLANLSKETKLNTIKELYGEDFIKTYPALAQALPFNDPQLIEKATRIIAFTILKDCPNEIFLMMKEHINYMNEISEQKMAAPQFAAKFIEQTGMTMEHFKKVRSNSKAEQLLSGLLTPLKEGEKEASALPSCQSTSYS